ncbi:hypothetical protein [Streptomyces sp. CFMR 7]|uniref:hypothetical protein n=1 Tax=Streptomyces sp. CFMR 7 TaxID=1649184 RepID=UPI0011A97F35|nr:hypothetical protein [Streptomyces sp. CFMR 7]
MRVGFLEGRTGFRAAADGWRPCGTWAGSQNRAGGTAGGRSSSQTCDRYVAQYGSLKEVRRDYVDEQGYVLGDSAPERKQALEKRGMSWESVGVAKPGRDVTAAEAGRLAALPPEDLDPEILRLVDEENVTQSGIADVLDMGRPALNAQVRAYRESG